jgi:hypothetical protein
MSEVKQELVKQSNQAVQFNFFNNDHFATMQRVCTMFANSELVPEMYRISEKTTKEKAIANCMIAIETANRIGASPLMVMQNMFIVQGKPSWSAKFLTATVNACGKYSSMKYKIKSLGMISKVEYNEYVWDNQARKKLPQKRVFEGPVENLECVAYATERGSDEVLESIPVSIEMAIKEGWYTKDNSKWQTMTRLMLQYRAVTYWTNAYAPELSMGIKTREELEDIEEIPFENVSAKVDKEIKENANKQPINMDQQKPEPTPQTKAEEKKEPVTQNAGSNGTPKEQGPDY